MKVAITGGSGFVGRHLAERLLGEGHEVVLISRHSGKTPGPPDRATRVASDLSDPGILAGAFRECDAVAHCAGINRELGLQTFEHVHVEGTRRVVEAARRVACGASH